MNSAFTPRSAPARDDVHLEDDEMASCRASTGMMWLIQALSTPRRRIRASTSSGTAGGADGAKTIRSFTRAGADDEVGRARSRRRRGAGADCAPALDAASETGDPEGEQKNAFHGAIILSSFLPFLPAPQRMRDKDGVDERSHARAQYVGLIVRCRQVPTLIWLEPGIHFADLHPGIPERLRPGGDERHVLADRPCIPGTCRSPRTGSPGSTRFAVRIMARETSRWPLRRSRHRGRGPVAGPARPGSRIRRGTPIDQIPRVGPIRPFLPDGPATLVT